IKSLSIRVASGKVNVGALSGGNQQKVLLARLLEVKPHVLILDEPNSGVDPAARDDFWRLLIELSRGQGVTIFLSTHFMNEAQRCDRISLMHAGKVLACDTPQALQQQFHGDTLEAAFVTCLEQAQGGPEPTAPSATVSEAGAPPVSKRGFSLARLLAVASREGKELLRDKVRMAFALLGAMFMMVIFGYGISLDVENLAFACYDQGQSQQSRAYLEAFRSWRYFDGQAPIHDANELHQRLQRSQIKLALEIPPGFGRDLYAGRQPTVAAWLDGGMPFRAETSR
ncbi:ATP-binding cassette domain-containing protein, partial [Corynebacterium propinquum]